MNILLSYHWLKEYVATKKQPRELAKLLSLHSMNVERMSPEADLLSDKIVLGEILEVSQHPNADRLKLAVVSTGNAKHHVVCGAPNIKVGMKIAFAKTGAMVRWHGEGDPIQLQPAKIRGIESFGMICDDCEIGLAKEPNPIGVTDYSGVKAKPGTPMAEALTLDDTIMDTEITTNRIDAASVIGMAREVSAVTGEKFNNLKVKLPKSKGKLPLSVTVEDSEKCLGFHGVVLAGAKVGPSPEWLKRRLRATGHSSFNNVVDVTNYVMREIGHPLHAFDYDKIDGALLTIRAAKKDEKLATLDGKTETLQPFMAVVADKKQGQAIAGVMGGEAAKITEGTTTILLEAASWNAATIRKTMKALDKFSDAGGYFSKGLSPQLAEVALQRAIALICEVTGAHVASPIISKGMKAYKPAQVKMEIANAERVIGAKLKEAQVKKWLEALGFEPKVARGKVVAKVPHWRQSDVSIEEDLIEEVARMYGYQNIANVLPSGQMPIPSINAHLEYEDRLKTALQGAGYTELYTYSMVSETLFKLSKRQVGEAIKLLNPLDADHALMRTRLLPSLLEIAAQNQGVVAEQRLFEIANVYTSVTRGDLPDEHMEMAGVVVLEDVEAAFREVKGAVLHALKQLGLDKAVQWETRETELTKSNESLVLVIGKQVVGTVGVVRAEVAQAVGLKRQAVVFELALRDLINMAETEMAYQPIPKFPPIELDLSITVAANTPWGKVEKKAMQTGEPLLRRVELFDIYDHEDGQKSFGFHLEYRSDEKTMEMKDVEALQQKVVQALEKELKARLR